MIQIVLPLPDKRLHQNARVHYRPKARATAKFRKLACDVISKHKDKFVEEWPVCKIFAVYVFPDNRRRDVNNYHAAMKPVWDGFEDAGLYIDDRKAWCGGYFGIVVKGVAEVRLRLTVEYPPRLEI